MAKKIILIAGPSGAGKTTISEYLTDRYQIPRVITHTTRPKRPGESGSAYYFEDDDSFARLDSLSERASSAVVEIGYVYDSSASSSSNKSTMTFGSWESRSLCHGRYADE